MNQPNFNVVMLAKGKARVELYDVLGPSWAGMIDAKMVSKQLKDAGELTEIELRINSPGGSAFEGLAIHNLLKDHPAKVHVVVDGVAASAASLVAMAGDTVRVPKNAMFMLHEASTFAFGNKSELQRSIDTLEAVNTAGVETYAAKTGKSHDEIREWMKAETWFTGQEAVDAGLADTTEKELPLAKVEPKASVQQMFSRAPSEFSSLYALSMRQTKEPPMAETVVTPPVAPAPAVPAAPQLTAADVDAARDQARKEEQTRSAAIMAICQRVGKPELASDFIANGASIPDVNAKMVDVLCQSRPPVGDAGGQAPPPAADPDAKIKEEYAADRGTYMKAGISEEDYVTSRRITAGDEQLQVRS